MTQRLPAPATQPAGNAGQQNPGLTYPQGFPGPLPPGAGGPQVHVPNPNQVGQGSNGNWLWPALIGTAIIVGIVFISLIIIGLVIASAPKKSVDKKDGDNGLHWHASLEIMKGVNALPG